MLKETIMALTLTGALALTNAAADDSTRSKASDDRSRGNKSGKQVITGVVDQTGDAFVIATRIDSGQSQDSLAVGSRTPTSHALWA